MCKHLQYDEQVSNACESEPNDSIGSKAEREAPLDSQEKEAVESDETVGCEHIIFYKSVLL